MTTTAPLTKKPPHRLAPVEGVVPTCEDKNMTSIAQTTATVEDALIKALDAAPVGSAAEDLTHSWEKASDGWHLYTAAAGLHPDTVTAGDVVASIAGTSLDILPPELESVRLPARTLAPHVARWKRLADANGKAACTVRVGEPDPSIRVPMPAWNDTDRWDGTVRAQEGDYRWWRSKPVCFPVPGQRAGVMVDGSQRRLSAIGIVAKQSAISGVCTVEAVVFLAESGEEEVRLKMAPSVARRVAEAILAAADLLDPDAEFEAGAR